MNSAALNARTASAAPQPQACHACKCRQLLSRRVPPAQRQVECNAIAPETLQDIIVGGAVVGAVSVALYSGLKKDPVPCSLCQGTGGIRCFACGGDGRNATVSRDDLYDSKSALGGGAPPPKRDPLGRSINPRDCKVCRGAGLVLCSQCKGSGFQSAF
ncbi:hypothetical protein HXX76_006339 [Chlamydomonas incerta]|uniref:Uncharacterized protein n=1 Tax=Chlamydomonas incerta TaxID=51695 RepID=A0A835T4E2_CHLIN|nr:hypothetical protein HXX76_006339 [Chlamydomonas incerta]|eukprot:KAG2436817.1 hypothetical protein HXX76_006339 [Chlamydomonas incerta]